MMPSTGFPAIDWFLALLDTWGYLIVLGFTVFENLFVIGSLTPGETVVIAASAVAANGQLQVIGVWVASFVGTILGSNISYWLGRSAGLEAVQAFAERMAATRVGRLMRVDASALGDVQQHFHTQGAKTVLISRFAIGAKNFVPAMAGATRMPVFWFELYTAIGAAMYTSIMCLIGWFLGENLDRALGVASGIGYAGLGILLIFLGLLWYGRRRYRSRRGRGEGGHGHDEAGPEAHAEDDR
ncbi:MAG TPA: DedA family protein [Coriobacteriia bacterium]|nr:DedA family protein [Coriobacteriia bacterium]